MGGLIGVRVSSVVKWGYEDNFKHVYFFFAEVLGVKKHSQAKINQKNKIKQTLNNKGKMFCDQRFLRGWKSFVLPYGAFFMLEIYL